MIINDFDSFYIVFDTKNRNIKLALQYFLIQICLAY